MSQLWNDLKRQGVQGRDELFKVMYPDFPSGWSGYRPDQDQPSDNSLNTERGSLESRVEIAGARDDRNREGRDLDRE